MSDRHTAPVPRTAFTGILLPTTHGRGVVVSGRDGLGIATVLARKGKSRVLAQRMRERFGLELPHEPGCTSSNGCTILGTGPGAWVALQESGANTFARTLSEALEGLASVSDHSDGYAVLRLTGPGMRDALCKLIPIDLHDRAFRVGDVAVTAGGHIATTLWRVEDRAGTPVYDIAVYRSFAMSFWQCLFEAAAEFGRCMEDERLAQGQRSIARCGDARCAPDPADRR